MKTECEHDWAYNKEQWATERKCRLCGRIENRDVRHTEYSVFCNADPYTSEWRLLIKNIDYHKKEKHVYV